MSNKKAQDVRLNQTRRVKPASKEPAASVPRRNPKKVERVMSYKERNIGYSPLLLPYTPPDVIMYALFSAIQRRAWMRARGICRELIVCDPLRQTFHDLYYRIDQIIRIMDQRARPQASNALNLGTRLTTATSVDSLTELLLKYKV